MIQYAPILLLWSVIVVTIGFFLKVKIPGNELKLLPVTTVVVLLHFIINSVPWFHWKLTFHSFFEACERCLYDLWPYIEPLSDEHGEVDDAPLLNINQLIVERKCCLEKEQRTLIMRHNRQSFTDSHQAGGLSDVSKK